ncbi:unnamed protein product, partial [marine sediment metagenome]
RPYALTWKEIKQMSRDGIEFGSHGINHTILAKVKKPQAECEISLSKSEIERKIGKAVLHFSYPNGERSDFDEQIKQFVKNNNYTSACSAVNGINESQDDVFSLKRITVNNAPLCIFASKISGIFDLLSICKREDGGDSNQ